MQKESIEGGEEILRKTRWSKLPFDAQETVTTCQVSLVLRSALPAAAALEEPAKCRAADHCFVFRLQILSHLWSAEITKVQSFLH